MSTNSKRKRPNYQKTHLPSQAHVDAQQAELERSLARLHVQAYEAEITRGPSAWDSAHMLEVSQGTGPGTGLIALRMGADMASGHSWTGQEDDVFRLGASASGDQDATNENERTLWVDRYDARLLLDASSLTMIQDQDPLSSSSTPSSSGWSDLPDDAGETFAMSIEEAEDYHRDKRRRLLEEAHERRMKERDAEDAATAAAESLTDPGPETLTLMRRTAAHLVAAANSTQLEMRILANHGGDERFAFLREGGKSWSIWQRIKQDAEDKARHEKEAKTGGLGALAGYSSDDDEEEEEEEKPTISPQPPSSNPPPQPTPPSSPPPPSTLASSEMEEDLVKAVRREKARRWLELRRSVKDAE